MSSVSARRLPSFRRHNLAIAAWLVWLAGWAPLPAQAAESPATYRVTFQGAWTTSATPSGVPGGAHFSPLIGVLHNDQVVFWRAGDMASAGIEDVAELGQTGAFRREIDASPHGAARIEKSLGGGPTPTASIDFEVTKRHPLVTLLTMIAPSPDWFVGVSGLSLLDARGRWLSRLEVNLFPYDAGTEDGTGFSLSNPATTPQGTIHSIRGMGRFTDEPMARLTFVRQDSAGLTLDLPLFPAAAEPLREGFVRLINHSEHDGKVTLTATDDSGYVAEPVSIAMQARQAMHFNSSDLEHGNAAKGLSAGVGQGQGDWRLRFESALAIEALAYVRADGFLTSVYDLAPKIGGLHRVSTFNPASNWRRASLLRLINPGDLDASVAIHGLDDAGAERGPVRLALPAGHARSISAKALEEGGTGLNGTLGNGQGKWRLDIEADREIQVMSLMESPQGQVTNLSSLPAGGS